MVTKDINIQELVKKHPKAAKVLIEEGIHCIGCIAAQFETLEQGLKMHGKSDEDIEKIIKKINEEIEKEEKSE